MSYIIVYIDPPDCGCGFMSIARVYALLSNQDSGDREYFNRGELILFPGVIFTCTGHLVKWILSGRWRRNRIFEGNSELQLWRKLGNTSSSVYKRLNHTTTLSFEDREDDDVYEISIDTGFEVQPGDILGMYISDERPSFHPYYEEDGSSIFYTSEIERNTMDIDINSDNNSFRTRYGIPLVSAVIGK